MRGVLFEVAEELARAVAKFPDQHLPDGTPQWSNPRAAKRIIEGIKKTTDDHAKAGTLTWRHVLDEEVHEAFAESNWPALRAELLQVAAMAVRWIEDGDARDAAKGDR